MGYSNQNSNDDEVNNWFKTAMMAKQLGGDFEKEQISEAANKLSNGEELPSDMRDSVRLGARKMLADNMAGAAIEAEQQIMNDINIKAKEQGVGAHEYLKKNVESYLTSPQNFRAVGNISKMFQERQVADANYQKAKMEEGKDRYNEVSALVQAADGLYQSGDVAGSKKMIEQISKIIPIPGYVKANEKTGEIEAYTTDFKTGGHKPTGGVLDPKGFLDAAKTVTRDEFAYGFGMNSQVVNEMNAKNLLKPDIMTDSGGGRYIGSNFTNPYDATDTNYIIRQHGTGKEVARFKSLKEAVDSGYTAYDQKYVKGELDIANEKKQGRNLDLTGRGLALDISYKGSRNDEQFIQTDIARQTKGDKIRYEGFKADKEGTDATKSYHDSITAGLKTQEERSDLSKKQLEQRAGVLEATMSGGAIFNGKTKSSGTDENSQVYAATEIQQAKKVNDVLFDMGVDPMLIPSISSESLKRAAPLIKDPNKYFSESQKIIAELTGKQVEEVQAYASPNFRALPNEEKQQVIQHLVETNAQRRKDEEKAAVAAEGNKESEKVFSDISARFEKLKSQNTAIDAKTGKRFNLYTGKEITDEELWKEAAQPTVFGKDLYDMQGKYFPDRNNTQMLGMAKKWSDDARAVEAEKLKRESMAKTNQSLEKTNRREFFKYGAGN